MTTMRMSIAESFSKTPGSRYRSEGVFSGEQFRTDLLFPALQRAIDEKGKLLVDLDGTAGYGTSFLEEAFGGLVRIHRLTYKQVKAHLDFVSTEEPYLIDDVWMYIEEAKAQ